MRILVLWRRGTIDIRNTILDHACCFKRYDKSNEYFYFDVYNGRYAEDYNWINEEMFDMVIFHYSAISLRYQDRYWDNFLRLMVSVWRDYPCKKILLPQDDYSQTCRIWDLANGVNADTIYTIIRECDYPVIYPEDKLENIMVKTVLTGYVEEAYVNSQLLVSHKARKYDVVYRARKLPYEFGRHGQLKYELVVRFEECLKNSGLTYELGNTDGDVKAILGDSWLDFLASSRITIGCLGGSGFADITGEYKNRVSEYVKIHQEATYEETKEVCFPGIQENLTGMISPRIFESAITKTCQVLIGEDYQGILRPNIDYIVLNKDFSNINDIIMKMRDIDYCEQIADNCYEHIVQSQKYTYRKFVEWVINDVGKFKSVKNESKDLSRYIEAMCKKNNDRVMKEIRLNS